MAWSNEEISQFQIDNNKALAEINATLMPDKNLSGKIGVFAPGQMGDLMTCMSVLKYRKEIFGDKEIIWFANNPNADCLRYAPISEVRPWPWAGNGLPYGTADFWPLLMNENNRLNVEKAKEYELTNDLIDGYFPCPYMLAPEKRHNIDYPNCSRKVFGVPDDWEWHPLLSGTSFEKEEANEFIKNIGGKKNVLIETFAGSSQSVLDESMVFETIKICKKSWPTCNIIFASHKFLRGNEDFPYDSLDDLSINFCSHFTPRQCALIADQCDLMISVSSGITVAASAWGIKQPPTLQFCGSFICSTKSLSNTVFFELVTADNKTLDQAKQEFYTKLGELLNQYK